MGTVLERDNTEYPSWFKCVEILKYKYKNEKKKVQSNIKEKFLCAEKEKKCGFQEKYVYPQVDLMKV